MSEFPIEAFVNTHDQLLAAVAGLSEDQLQWKQAPHIWSIQEVLSHLVDHSIVISFRIRDILAGTTVQLPAFNQDAWVNGQYSNEGRAADILEAFRALLHYNSLLLRRLSAADTIKTGINFKGRPSAFRISSAGLPATYRIISDRSNALNWLQLPCEQMTLRSIRRKGIWQSKDH